MFSNQHTRFIVVSSLIVSVALTRLIPHPPNFTPVAAMALFAGASFSHLGLALLIPLSTMFISDLVLELLFGIGFHNQLIGVYSCLAATVLLGTLLKNRKRLRPLTMMSISASLLFFVGTNFTVWAAGDLYPRTASGLANCFVAAIPFFGPTLIGDYFYIMLLFGIFALIEQRFFYTSRGMNLIFLKKTNTLHIGGK